MDGMRGGLQQERRREQQILEVRQEQAVQERQLERQEQQRQDEAVRREQRQNVFMSRLLGNPLPDDIPVAGAAQQRQEPLGRKERKRRMKAYQTEAKHTDRLTTLEDVMAQGIFETRDGMEKWADTIPKHSRLTNREIMRRVEAGDFSNFENLDGLMRSMVANKKLQEMEAAYAVNYREDPQALCDRIQQEEGVQGLLNPGLRLGLSLAQRTAGVSPERREFYRRLDEAMTTAVMVATLTKDADPDEVEPLVRDKYPDWSAEQMANACNAMIEDNKAQQVQIAKRMLLMQLSRFQVQRGNELADWDRSMAVAVSHCSRVVLTLPHVVREDARNSQEMQRFMWNSIFMRQNGVNWENAAQDNKRGSSTHDVERRKVNRAGSVTKEKKVWFNLSGQRGMNCAIGGLGSAGISGQTLANDGSCGHFYSMYREGTETEYGAMLMGLESDAYGVTNQMGHTHDLHATAEKASSLGGQRTDEIGNKYGGRQCDLSHLSAGDIAVWMTGLERAMRRWQEAGGMSGADAARAMRLLAGNKVTEPADVEWLREQFEIPREVGGLA